MAEERGRITFVMGGAKSGKSSFALDRAGSFPGRKIYIATAEPFDDEMRGKIEKHRQERGDEWGTIEEPLKIADVIRSADAKNAAILIDCLTLWLSNLLRRNDNAERAIEDFLNSLLLTAHSSRFFVVSNEVGMGIVPDNALSRRFRDLAGQLNQKVAEIADEVYLVTAGIPLKLKP